MYYVSVAYSLYISFLCISNQALALLFAQIGAFVRPDLSNECAIPNILNALRFRLHFHCIFLFPCISKQAFNKCPFSTHEMCSDSSSLTNEKDHHYFLNSADVCW